MFAATLSLLPHCERACSASLCICRIVVNSSRALFLILPIVTTTWLAVTSRGWLCSFLQDYTEVSWVITFAGHWLLGLLHLQNVWSLPSQIFSSPFFTWQTLWCASQCWCSPTPHTTHRAAIVPQNPMHVTAWQSSTLLPCTCIIFILTHFLPTTVSLSRFALISTVLKGL